MKFKSIYAAKTLRLAIHIIFWGLVIISPYLFRNPNTYSGFSSWHYKLMINNAMLAVIFYLNAYLLYPIIYKRKGLWLYILSAFAVIAGALFLSRWIDQLLFPGMNGPRGAGFPQAGRGDPHGPHANFRHFDGADSNRVKHMRFGPDRRGFDRGWFGWYFTNIITYLFVGAGGISYRIIRDNNRQEKAMQEKANENLKTELSFLRSQVSPHFLFNTLNNMVSLARKKSDMLEPSLIELSKLMRYMLYENDDERVLLLREVEYLKSYIALQMLRFGDDVTIVFNPPENINAYYIEPMLLAPFVENAFKHGVGMVESPEINIVMSIDDATGWLNFKVMNTVAPPQDSKDKSSGIGLANVRRRLELLYKQDFQLDIMQNDKVFIADLKLKLK